MSQPSRRQLAEATLVMLKTLPAEHVSKALASYLVANRRSKELDALMRDIESLRKTREDIVEATAVSAFELSSATKDELFKLLESPKGHITYKQDPEVVGGVRLRTLDWQLDTTVATALKHLKQLTL